MPEAQNIEYKLSWNDDYLKWIAGFANAQGGVLFIGKDDKGAITGLVNYKKLMDDLPNKVRDKLGVMVEVNLYQESNLHFIELVVQPYAVPISLRGVYYYRSGSTNQELKGNSLIEFLLKKTGKSWDDVTESSIDSSELDLDSIFNFLEDAKKAGRLPIMPGISYDEALEKLRLSEKGKLKRGAIVLFGKNPGKFYPNMAVKIGRFGDSDDDLKFQEILEGNLVQLLRDVPDILNRKFFVKSIDFEGLHRVERGEYPVAALREILLNALVHRSYMGSAIQIRMYDNRFSIWNEGLLPEGLTLEALKRQHPSRPRNPLIADVSFKGGYIDAWGRGTLKIINACKEAGLPEPEIIEQDGGMLVTMFKSTPPNKAFSEFNLNERQKEALEIWKNDGEITTGKYMRRFSITDRTSRRDLLELVQIGLLTKVGDKKSTRYLFK